MVVWSKERCSLFSIYCSLKNEIPKIVPKIGIITIELTVDTVCLRYFALNRHYVLVLSTSYVYEVYDVSSCSYIEGRIHWREFLMLH